MINTELDVSKVAGANFFPVFPVYGGGVGDQEFAQEVAAADTENKVALGNFNLSVSQWLNDAAIARNAGGALPPKPIATASVVIVREDLPNGVWVARIPGPPLGVCPDLPAPAGSGGPAVTGLVPVGTPAQPTQDQKLDAIYAAVMGVKADIAALKAKGVI